MQWVPALALSACHQTDGQVLGVNLKCSESRCFGRPSVPPNQTSVAGGDSVMSLDSRQTALGPTSRPVVTAEGRDIDEARLPALLLNRVSQPFWSRARQRNGASIHRRALYERGKLGLGWTEESGPWIVGRRLRNR